MKTIKAKLIAIAESPITHTALIATALTASTVIYYRYTNEALKIQNNESADRADMFARALDGTTQAIIEKLNPTD